MLARRNGPLSRPRSLARSALVCAVLGALGCSTSRIENAWVDPTATPQSFELKRVLVVAAVNDGAIRRATEDALVNVLRSGARGQSGELAAEPSYRLLSDRDLLDAATARHKVDAAGYDGAVLISFVSSQQRVTVDPPMYGGGGFWGPYGYGASMYDAGSVRTDTILKLQVSIYSLTESRMLWSGVSSTLNPSKIDKLVVDVADAVREELRKNAIFPDSPPTAP